MATFAALLKRYFSWCLKLVVGVLLGRNKILEANDPKIPILESPEWPSSNLVFPGLPETVIYHLGFSLMTLIKGLL